MSAAHRIFVYDDRESVLRSVTSDLVSFGGLIGTAIALNTLIPPSGWLNFALAFAWIVWLIGRGQKRTLRMTPQQTRTWLDETFPVEGDK